MTHSQKLMSLAETVQLLNHDMQEIAHVSALAQKVMQRDDADPDTMQFIFKKLCVIEKITGCKGDGSQEFWSTRITED